MSARALDRQTTQPLRGVGFAVRGEWLALLVVAVLAAVRLFGPVDPDVAWQLWIAHQIDHGVRLYRDVVEVNPPLWFWIALPIDRAAGLTGIPPEALLIAAVAGLQLLSLSALSALLPQEGRRKATMLAFTAVVLGGFAWAHAGQREQLVLIAALPYAALAAARRNGRRVSPAVAIAVGVGSGLGFALKHYFLLVPALLELWLLARQRRGWSPFRPELFGLVAVGVAYAAAILLFASDYLKLVVPLIRLGYGATGAVSFAQLFQPGLIVGALLLGLVLACHRRLDDYGWALVVASCGFAGAYFIQAKGWAYHSIPLVGCSAVAMLGLLAAPPEPRRAVRILGPFLLVLPLLLSWQEARHPRFPDPDVGAAVAGLPAGTNLGWLVTEPAYAFPLTLQRGFGFSNRYFGFWMLRSVVFNERRGSPNPALVGLGHRIVRETVEDFRCHPPARIIIPRPTAAEAAHGEFDILTWFERDPDFANLMRNYRLVSRTTADTYVLAQPLPTPPAASCTRRI